MSRRSARLLKASADARSRWPSLLLLSAAAALATALSTGGLLAMASVEASLAATTAGLGTPQIWIQARLPVLSDARPTIVDLAGGPALLIPQAGGAARRGGTELRAGLRPLALPRPPAEHLSLVTGAWPDANEDAVVIERGAAEALGILSLPASVDVAGPRWRRDLTVAAIARDVSQASYPLSTPAMLYLSGPAWDELVGDEAALGLMGVRVAAGRELRPVALSINAALPEDAERAIYSSRWVVDGLAPLTVAVAGFMLLFGLVALIATLLYIASATTAEAIQRSREFGALQATGWGRTDIGQLLRLPRIAAVAAGSGLGALTGVAVAAWSSAGLVAEMSLDPAIGGWFWIPVVVLAINVATWIAVGLGLRQVLGVTPAVALAGGMRALPGGMARALQRLPLPLSARLGATLLLSRARVFLLSAALLVLGLVTTMFAGISVATVDRFSTDPGVWGYAYDWQVRSLDPEDATVATILADLVGPSGVEPVHVSKLRLESGQRADIKFIPADSRLISVGLLEGRHPADTTEVLVGAGAARTHELRPGTVFQVRMEGKPVELRVAGVYRELEGLGQWFLGRDALYRAVRPDGLPAYYAVRVPEGTSADSLRTELTTRAAGRVVVTEIKTAIDFPFRAELRRILFGLAVALLALAAALLLSTVLIVAADQAYALAVLRALGASTTTSVGVVLGGAAVLIVPASVIGGLVGVAGSAQLLGALSSQIGGLDVVVSLPLLATLLVVSLLPPTAGFLTPVLLSLRRAPLRGLRAER